METNLYVSLRVSSYLMSRGTGCNYPFKDVCMVSGLGMEREEQRTYFFVLQFVKYKHNAPSSTKARKNFPMLCRIWATHCFCRHCLTFMSEDLRFEEPMQKLILNYCSVCINLSFVSDSEVLYLLPESMNLWQVKLLVCK